MGSPLPAHGFVTVHALDSGWFSMPEKFFVTPLEDTNARKHVPSLSFLIQHHDSESSTTTRLLFDLGIRRDINSYSGPIQKHLTTREPINGVPDIIDSLARGGLGPDDMDLVILSHLHWDHVGTPASFEKSHFVVGSGATDLLQGDHSGGSHNHFEPHLLPRERTTELQHPSKLVLEQRESVVGSKPLPSNLLQQPWRSVGPFRFGLDVFSDGSVYIIWAPGHLVGHINLLCRKKDSSYIYLAGDAAHDTRLLSGTKDIAVWNETGGHLSCIHQCPEAARETISHIRRAWDGSSSLGSVEVVLAHDADWAKDAKAANRFFPGQT